MSDHEMRNGAMPVGPATGWDLARREASAPAAQEYRYRVEFYNPESEGSERMNNPEIVTRIIKCPSGHPVENAGNGQVSCPRGKETIDNPDYVQTAEPVSAFSAMILREAGGKDTTSRVIENPKICPWNIVGLDGVMAWAKVQEKALHVVVVEASDKAPKASKGPERKPLKGAKKRDFNLSRPSVYGRDPKTGRSLLKDGRVRRTRSPNGVTRGLRGPL